MAVPIMNEYISATCKSFVSNDNNGKMIKKDFIKIEGTFLVKICNNAFNRNDGEDVFKHINSFLKVVEPLKVRGLSNDRFRLSVFPISLSGAAREWFTNSCIGTVSTWNDLVKKFILKFHDLCELNEEETDDDYDPHTFDDVNTYKEYEQKLNADETQGSNRPLLENRGPHQLCDHICEPYHFKNGKTKWPTCSSDIDGFCNGGELPEMVRVETMTYFQDHKWYDELADGKLKDETLALKANVEGTWGDATPGVMKFCMWLKNSFVNFHELNYDVLVKLQDCWWKINAHETAPFTRSKDFGRGPYANIKTKITHDPYLDTNRIFNRTNTASNVGNTQEDQGHKDVNLTPAQSVCKIRRFEMMKYSFDSNDEYIAMKESEHLNHSKKSLDSYRELLRLTNEGWVVTTLEE
ncbi:hypothetical protein Tco_1569009 [Tanacetum coccineum]